MTGRTRTLAEAAADVLNKSRTSSPKEPMHKLDNSGSGLDGVVDLGGATHENPAGTAIGAKASEVRSQASPPGIQPSKDTKAPRENIETKRGKQPQTQSAGEVSSPTEHDGAHGASHGEYVHPTSEEVETSTTDEENTEVLVEEPTAEEIAAAKAERMERAKDKMKSLSCKEDVDAMFSGETLSEEFKTKATTIFEAAVLARAVLIADALEEEILQSAEEALNESRAEIETQVDSYLSFAVENWVKENQVAIESGLKSEVVEDFMSGLKNLFAEHYIDVPAEKTDLISDLSKQVEELTAKVNETINTNIDLTKKLAESKKNEILSTVCEGLTATQAAKVKTLAEGVEFTTEGEYTKKLQVIRESYFTSVKTVKQGDGTSKTIALTESDSPAIVEEEKTVNSDNPQMKHYVDAISRTQK